MLNFSNRVINIFLPLYVIYVTFYPLPPLQERAIFALLLISTFFLGQSVHQSTAKRIISLMFVLGAVVSFGYTAVFHEIEEARFGLPTTAEIILGSIATIAVLEATRRAMGLALLSVILVFLLYGLLGQYIPLQWGGHAELGADRVVKSLYVSTQGLYGIVLYVMYKYVFLFVFFGRVLKETGALDFVMNFARSLVGHIRGGPAMISVLSSGFVGSISGSAVANVTITGSVTIPMMKNMGFKPHVAGAIEAAASTGGQFMPPVMGAASFLIMQFLGIPYLSVMKAALVPSIIYFSTLTFAAYIYAGRSGIAGLPKEDRPELRNVLPRLNALSFLGGLGTLMLFLLLMYSPIYAALVAVVVMVIVSFFGKDRLTPKKSVRILEETTDTFITVGVAGIGVGIIVSIVMLTGLGSRFSSLIIGMAGSNLLLTLLLTMLISIVLGTGLPTTVTYILLAVLVAPGLVKLGVTPLAAHMFIFFAGMMSMVTPPVALAAYAGASLAGASMWKTAATASVLSLPAYILPYIFVLDNSLLLMGSVYHVLVAVVRSFLGCIILSYASVGPARDRKEVFQRLLLGIGAVMFIFPDYRADIAAILIIFCGVGVGLTTRRMAKAGFREPTVRRDRPL